MKPLLVAASLALTLAISLAGPLTAQPLGTILPTLTFPDSAPEVPTQGATGAGN
ncbi:hypothetical protein [Maritimibacter sp. 55A14]|uniref:hypothetical protein n=1 Tax=Maritimibacter sp. 55A14 TaxID=2174844 RepID=UPI0013048898|nr:hypothetical protein [Maritimibacter sp. 55A14]